jgi:hypothetical protein
VRLILSEVRSLLLLSPHDELCSSLKGVRSVRADIDRTGG